MVAIRTTPMRSNRAPNAAQEAKGAPILATIIGVVRTGRPEAHGLAPADARLSSMDFQTAPPAPARPDAVAQDQFGTPIMQSLKRWACIWPI